MDTYLATQKTYQCFLSGLSVCATQTMHNITQNDRDSFSILLHKAKRIYFTGAGSSIASSLYGAYMSMSLHGLAAQYIPTGHILSTQFTPQDLVILNTQGYNRGDSLLVTQKVLRDGAQLAVMTANKTAAIDPSVSFHAYFEPFPEKLFCRPVGVITNMIVMGQLLEPHFSVDSVLEAIRLGESKKDETILDAKKYIVLSSGSGCPVGYNFALALREGCGADASFFDIETYGHGMYVSDQVMKKGGCDIAYILIDFSTDTHLHKSVQRIMQFITGTHSPYQIFASFQSPLYASIELLVRLAQMVYKKNDKNKYDMNNPPGKEENRYYHHTKTYEL